MEGLLENHLLDELEEDLLLELDAKVRENQLAYLPFVRSGRAEMLLDAKYPDLMASKTRERQTKIDSVNLRAKIGALLIDSEGEPISTSSKARRKSSKPGDPGVETILALGLNSKASTADLMFTMDEEDVAGRNVASAGPEIPARSPRPSPGGITSSPRMTPREDVWYGSNGKIIPSPLLGPVATSPSAVCQESKPRLMGKTATSQSSGGDSSAQAWGSSPALSSSKLDLKQILAQTSVGRRSNLSAQMPLRVKEQNGSALPIVGVKLSQKERKKQQLQLQQQQQHELRLQQQQEQEQQQARQSVHLINSSASKPVAVMEESPKPTSPWQSQSVGPRVSLQEVLSGATRPVSESLTQTSSIPIISLESGPSTRSKYNGSPSGLPHSPRVSSHSKTNFPGLPGSSPTPSARIPQAEPTLQLSMAEIIVQQRTEQEILRQAVAKRSLQEIQQEQEFMEWWDSEARKTALAAAELKMDASRGLTRDGESDRGTRGARGGSRGRGRGRGRGEGGSRGGSSSAQKPVRDETKTGSPDSKKMIPKGRGRGGSSRGKQTSRIGPS